ncbi:helicase-related protein [Sphaerisporangium rhizosphaerae]|uniref:Helicase-related protein n=1 Tax=Sphaerisporangium rhizosphaerae TaxID=2269375 RepID=A0ABW2P6J2_9ACTN
MTRIFDNIKDKLGEHLQVTLQEFERMDVAVGYFNLRGWRIFDQIVREKTTGDGPTVRILIGMVTAGPQDETLEHLQAAVDGAGRPEADATVARDRKAQFLDQLRTQLMRGLPSASDRATLQSLRSFLADNNVAIRVFTRRPLHGKTYIFHRVDSNNPIIGFVGSSNLTAPGLTHNLELNVDVVDSTAAANLAEWFENRWDDKFSRPVTADILALLDESWATAEPRRPYEVFLKVCYDLSRDVREGLAEYSIPPEIGSRLLDYQTTAVRTLARRIMTRGGTMLGDVVGLGKTLTAIAVALMLRDEHGYMPLVVCPKNLVSMWEEHLEAYELHGRVVAYSMAHAILPELRRYGFVIVDESHTLRNDTRRDYKAVQDYIHANESKTLLLTATPYNIRFLDVANQLGLYIDEDEDLGITPTKALAQDPRLADKVDGKITTLAAFRRSEDPDDWKRLMSEHLVRRTRSFIRSSYAKTDDDGLEYLEFSDGRRFRFPAREPRPISHSFGQNDPASIMADDDTLRTLTALSLPRYQMGKYLIKNPELNDDERLFVENLNRGRGQVAGFVRTTFYKRLSSCGYSFTLSLRRHIARNELFTYAIDQGLPIPTGTIVDTNLVDDDDPTASELDTAERLGDDPARRYEALSSAAPNSVTWVRPSMFTAALRADLDRDTAALRGLLVSYGGWSADVDSKLAALLKLIQKTHPDEKILVFTEYKDTATYVGAELKAAGVSAVGVVTGDSDNPTALAHRFAPASNTLPGHEVHSTADELRILIATDVLSEGQNLQDAYIVVNYDLPWAIIRLIQRAGRVDRIGQQSDQVFIYSFFHESVDAVISLRQRIAARLSANAEAFGSDEQFFGTDGEVKAITDLYNGTLDDLDAAEEVDASSLAYQYWRAAEQLDPAYAERVAALPDMIDATRRRRVTDMDDGVLCYVRTEAGIDGFAFANPDGEPRLLTGHEVLRAFESTPDEPGLEIRPDHEDLVKELVRGVLATPHVAAGRLRGVRRTLWRRLGETLQTHDLDTTVALDALYQHPLTAEADRRLRRAVRNGVSDEDLASRIASLHRDNQLVIQSRTDNDSVRIVSTMGVRP